MTTQSQMPIQSGDRAPDFVVPAVHEDRTISLADYRGKTPVLLGLFRGLYCPFCRRALAQMAATSENLRSLGVDSLAIVGTELDNARLYFKFRPTRLALGADPHLTTHRSYGVPRPEPTPEMMQMMENTYINPTGELPTPLPVPAAQAALAKLDGYQLTPTDRRDYESTFTQLKGQFLIDRDGIVRWSHIECSEGLSSLGKFPSHDELLGAARIVLGSETRMGT
ncbi:MAG TPA: redoxin domain-containing protein [Vicinamibacterales bacterium]|nr:redoxin domain-containing protein [Vicinamibacterales bacterium]